MISGVIARYTGLKDGKPTFSGRIHLYDSYPGNPHGLGETLWHLYYGFFAKDLNRMLAMLIDAHPAGWNSIVKADFNHPHISYEQRKALADKKGVDWTEIPSGPECLCHPPKEPVRELHENVTEDLDWAYVFDNKGFTILRAGEVWYFVHWVTWDYPEPNWQQLTFASAHTPWTSNEVVDLEPPTNTSTPPKSQKTKAKRGRKTKWGETLWVGK